MSTIFDFLNNARLRPHMYIGWNDRTTQLQHLESIIHGYEQALQAHGTKEPGENFSRAFRSYLEETRNWDTTCGIAAAFIENSSNEEAAWERFWELVEELRRERFPTA